MQLTLEQLFGVGASQTSTHFFIRINSHLTPEGLLAAIFKAAMRNFRGYLILPNGNPLLTQNGETLDFDNSDLYDIDIENWSIKIINGKIVHQFVLKEIEVYDNN